MLTVITNEQMLMTTITLGESAPRFSLRSIQGETVQLESYEQKRHVLLWFSRGFQCPFCRSHMSVFEERYEALQASGFDIIQVAPNLFESARLFFRQDMPPFPFICDPDKMLYALYGLGDRGVMEASRNTFVSFTHAARQGEFRQTVRGSWLDVMNRNFLRRLHHHALTAMEQGLFLIDKALILRHRAIFGPIETIPSSADVVSWLGEGK